MLRVHTSVLEADFNLFNLTIASARRQRHHEHPVLIFIPYGTPRLSDPGNGFQTIQSDGLPGTLDSEVAGLFPPPAR